MLDRMRRHDHESRVHETPLRCYQYAVGFIIASDPNNNQPDAAGYPVAMHMCQCTRTSATGVLSGKTATVNGTTIDFG
jgi:hypothetical protein